ncbi:nucleotidyltransferase family protein [uncultured Porphyromonas sp.]|uniref:nucleotidyltransferase family protein n=1 Tax=uncultured Porphyromonas sp. TaxID=159274 RepID=UPI00261FA56D|nr:nucleotidyltransferase family protein [uncultured Porphyromonas sp.]
MDRASIQFIELLRAATKRDRVTVESKLSLELVPQLWRLAQRHQVEGMIADQLLSHEELPLDTSIQLMSYTQGLQRLSSKMSATIAQLVKDLERHHLHPILIKGHANAVLYPNPLLRTVGDIDLFFRTQDEFRKVMALMHSRGYKIHSETKSDKLLHKAVEIKPFLLECHGQLLYLPMTHSNKLFQAYYTQILRESPQATISIHNTSVQVLPPELQLVHTFLHFWSDFLYGGAQLKRLLDLYFIVERYGEMVDRSRLSHLLCEMKLEYQLSLFGALLHRWFHLPIESMPWPQPQPTATWHRDIQVLAHSYFQNRAEHLTSRAPHGSLWRHRFWKWWSIMDFNYYHQRVLGHYAFKAPISMLLFRAKETVEGR